MKGFEGPVVICGGGPVGLSAAILLARLGVRSILVERHPSTTDHPKARGFFTRTMEVLRPCRFTMLARSEGEGGWRDAGRRAAEELGVPFAALAIGPGGDFDDGESTWAELYGLEPGGAVLVRSDGHVAWRSRRRAPEPDATMRVVLRAVLRR